MPNEVIDYSAAAWGSSAVNWIPLIAGVLLFVLVMPQLFSILPYLVSGTFRDKPLADLEQKPGLASDRNIVALVMILPFCSLISRFDLFSPVFLHPWIDKFGSLLIIAIFIALLLFRLLVTELMVPRRKDKEAFRMASSHTGSFFIIWVLLLVLSAVFLHIFGLNDLIIKAVLYTEIVVFYAVFLLRKLFFLIRYCSLFSAFLYLCALEILPVALLVGAEVFY